MALQGGYRRVVVIVSTVAVKMRFVMSDKVKSLFKIL